eukprot:15003940-Alexandrium_andersonii.AAC.1
MLPEVSPLATASPDPRIRSPSTTGSASRGSSWTTSPASGTRGRSPPSRPSARWASPKWPSAL